MNIHHNNTITILKLWKWSLNLANGVFMRKKKLSQNHAENDPIQDQLLLKSKNHQKLAIPSNSPTKAPNFKNKCIILKPGSEKTQPLQLALWIRRLSASVSFTKMSKFSTSSFSIAFLKGSGRSFNHLVKFLPIVLNVFQLFQQDSARWLGISEWSPGWNWWNLPVGQWRYRMNHPP